MVNIVDIESTCFEDKPADQKLTEQVEPISEIIEVGIVAMDPRTQAITDRRSFMIRPEHSTVSEFCTKLTGWTQADVDKAPTYVEVIEQLKKEFKIHRRAWFSWGDYDRSMFERMSLLHKRPYPFYRTHINLKALFAMCAKLTDEVGLEMALRIQGMTFDGRPHKGVDDAYNEARVLALILKGSQDSMTTKVVQ
jgi:inhibitor of KinA sporulation pathway (predicted exonuclease)